MATFEELIALLERTHLWKRLTELPARFAALEQRVLLMEDRIASDAPTPCTVCGSPGFELVRADPDPFLGGMGLITNVRKCTICGHLVEEI